MQQIASSQWNYLSVMVAQKCAKKKRLIKNKKN